MEKKYPTFGDCHKPIATDETMIRGCVQRGTLSSSYRRFRVSGDIISMLVCSNTYCHHDLVQ